MPGCDLTEWFNDSLFVGSFMFLIMLSDLPQMLKIDLMTSTLLGHSKRVRSFIHLLHEQSRAANKDKMLRTR